MNDGTIRGQQKGFTIVELLIVIVVIGILAAITIVAFNGVQDRAKTAAVQSSASQAIKKVLLYSAQNADQYPTTLADAGVVEGANGVTYQFTSDNTVSPHTSCVTATSGTISYYVSGVAGSLKQGICSGHNLLVWNKTQALSTTPVPAASVDTSVYRTSIASMRLSTGQVGIELRDSPFTGSVGQSYTVSLWIKTDANWNGTGGNSKIRFGDAANNGALLSVCSYAGVKTVWTFVTCSRTLTSAALSLQVTVGNDGSVGTIWLDDLSITRSE